MPVMKMGTRRCASVGLVVWLLVTSVRIAADPADEAAAAAAADEARITIPLRQAYGRFLEAVKAEDGAKIRAAIWTPIAGEPHEVIDLVVDQLLTFRRFERVAVEKLGKDRGDFGLGLTDAAIEQRIKATADARPGELMRFGGPALNLAPDAAGTDRIVAGLTASVPMTFNFGGEAPRLDLPRALGPTWHSYAVAAHGAGAPPGKEALAAFKRATTELEAGRITDRRAAENFLNVELQKIDDREYAVLNDNQPEPPPQDVAGTRQAVRAFIEAMRGLDAAALRGSFASPAEPAQSAALDHWVEQQITRFQIIDALAKLRNQPGFSQSPDFERTLSRLPAARLAIPKVKGVSPQLLLQATDRLAALVDPRAHAGFKGPPPEVYSVTKTPDGWRMSFSSIVPASGEDFARERYRNAEDESLRLSKELLARVRAGRVQTAEQFLSEAEEVGRRVAAVVEQRRLEKDEAEDAAYQKWARSEKGKRVLQALTAPDARLQFRLAVGAADAAAEDFPDPRIPGGTLRLAKTVLLNERAVARAYPIVSQNGSPAVGLELTDDGANQMHHITSANIGRQLAIVLDGKILIAPVIRSAIKQRLVIDGGSGGFKEEDVGRIVKALNPKPDR
jgi:hypothetical protein